MSDFTAQELNELTVELGLLDEEFSELNSLFNDQLLSLESESSEELSALNEALEGTGLDDTGTTGTSSQLSMLDLIDGNVGSQFLEVQGIFGGYFRRKVAKLIRKIVRLVRKYSKLRACIPAVTKAVNYFRAKKYTRALRSGYTAYRCIRARL